MTAQETVALYYEAWQSQRGEFEEMTIPGVGRMTSAEVLEVRDGVIVHGELIYDAEPLRRAMAQAAG
jgi:hypothetical protein